jgi:hypothetical protein
MKDEDRQVFGRVGYDPEVIVQRLGELLRQLGIRGTAAVTFHSRTV